jgi:hypothetical protein
VSPELSLGVSLIRRGRDIVVGVPILLLWQAIEMRHLRRIAAQQAKDAEGRLRRPGIRETQPME